MISKSANFFLTGAAIAPVVAICAILFCIEGNHYTAMILVVASIALTISGLAILKIAKSKVENLGGIHFKSVENADSISLGIIIIYLVPLIGTPISDVPWTILIPVIVMFAALSISGQGFHFNPLLRIIGWRFYKISTQEGVTFLLITKKSIRNPDAFNNNVGWLTEYTLIDLE